MNVKFRDRQTVVLRPNSILCNQYENENSEIVVALIDDLASSSYFYYMICTTPDGLTQFAVPMTYDNVTKTAKMIVGTSVSSTSGLWSFIVLIKEYEIVGGTIGEDGLVGMSQSFTATVRDNDVDPTKLGAQTMDPNLQIIYDDLQAMGETLAGAAQGEEDRVAAEIIRVQNETDRAALWQQWVQQQASFTDGEDGRGIVSIVRTAGTGLAGSTDTYTITFTDNTTTTFTVVNGRNGVDGSGSGDMSKSTYDTTNNGVVDNAEKVNGHTVLKDVPADAVFTDTVYVHPTTAGNKHIPAGGSANQVLKYSADGTAVWGTDADTIYTHPTTSGNKHVPAGGSVGNLLANSADGTAAWVSKYQSQTLVSASKTLAAADMDTHQKCISASTINILLPSDTTDANIAVNMSAMVSRMGAGAVTFTKDTGVTTVSKGDKLSIDSNCAVVVLKVAANTYWIFGALV
jgi:hypothetical protein